MLEHVFIWTGAFPTLFWVVNRSSTVQRCGDPHVVVSSVLHQGKQFDQIVHWKEMGPRDIQPLFEHTMTYFLLLQIQHGTLVSGSDSASRPGL